MNRESIWLAPSDTTKKASEGNTQPAKCRLCKVFSEPPFVQVSLAMGFTLRQGRMTVGKTAWQPYAEVEPASASHHKIFRLEFPGSERIRGEKSRRISPTEIDYELLLGWLNKCRQEHEAAYCWPEHKVIPGIKFIDCHTRCVVDAERGCQYVTLSYVWGSTIASGDTPGSYPPTIEDAITVTVALGFRYLWVDRCVRLSRGRHNSNALLTVTVY
jgi:hypothetical protein